MPTHYFVYNSIPWRERLCRTPSASTGFSVRAQPEAEGAKAMGQEFNAGILHVRVPTPLARLF